MDCPICRFEMREVVGFCTVCGYNPNEERFEREVPEWTPSPAEERMPEPEYAWSVDWTRMAWAGILVCILSLALSITTEVDFKHTEAGVFQEAYLHGDLLNQEDI